MDACNAFDKSFLETISLESCDVFSLIYDFSGDLLAHCELVTWHSRVVQRLPKKGFRKLANFSAWPLNGKMNQTFPLKDLEYVEVYTHKEFMEISNGMT